MADVSPRTFSHALTIIIAWRHALLFREGPHRHARIHTRTCEQQQGITRAYEYREEGRTWTRDIGGMCNTALHRWRAQCRSVYNKTGSAIARIDPRRADEFVKVLGVRVIHSSRCSKVSRDACRSDV